MIQFKAPARSLTPAKLEKDGRCAKRGVRKAQVSRTKLTRSQRLRRLQTIASG
jgi:hypothetical protein